MSMILKKFLRDNPAMTLSDTRYGKHFHLGHAVNILSVLTQRLQSFIESHGEPYKFLVVGQLASFEVVEDAVCLSPFASASKAV